MIQFDSLVEKGEKNTRRQQRGDLIKLVNSSRLVVGWWRDHDPSMYFSRGSWAALDWL
jgi:hypothetical protein